MKLVLVLLTYIFSYGPVVALYINFAGPIKEATGLSVEHQFEVLNFIYLPLGKLRHVPGFRWIIFDYTHYCCDRLMPVDRHALQAIPSTYEDFVERLRNREYIISRNPGIGDGGPTFVVFGKVPLPPPAR